MKRSLIATAVVLLFIASLIPAVAGPECKGGVCTLSAKPAVKSAVCPVLGTEIADVTKAAGKSVYKGKTYYFCCKDCKTKFDKNPAKYVKTAPAKVVSAVCPVMGTKIADVTKASGKSVYKGKTYYFCCKDCKPKFDKDPEKYLSKSKPK